MSSQSRLVAPEMLPATLWVEETGTLYLPPELSQAYVSMLERKELLQLAQERDPDNAPVGGATQEKTDQHFAQAFDGSVARAQMAVIDPKNHLVPITNAFINSLAGNAIVLADAPCGAGAVSFAFLATIAELRAKEILPRLPLDVCVIGAELSDPARSYAAEMLDDLRPSLERQGIFVEAAFFHWNVLDKISNTDLIRRMTRALQPSSKRLLVVANFNSFLGAENNRKKAEPQLGELFRHASGDNAIVIWIEPQMNTAMGSGGLFYGLLRLAKELWSKFAHVSTKGSGNEPFLTTASRFQSPITTTQHPQVRLAVMRFDLGRFP